MDVVKRLGKECRRGTATAEVALILPILLLVTFGAIRYGWFFLKHQQITNAARYGARIAIRAGGVGYIDENDNDVINYINGLMQAAGMGDSGYDVTITCSSGNWYEAPVGQPITVAVSVEAAEVDILPIALFSFEPDGWRLGDSVTMAKEGF